MFRNTHTVIISTNTKSYRLETDRKTKEGVYLLECPVTKNEICFRWKGTKEKNEVLKVFREIKDEYKLKNVA
jgi:hypothetical protein